MLPENYNTTVVNPILPVSLSERPKEEEDGEEEEEEVEEGDKKGEKNPNLYRKQTKQQKKTPHFMHSERVAAGNEKGAGHRRGGVHSFLSDDAETDEGVRTGQRVLAVTWRDAVFLSLTAPACGQSGD